MKKLIALVMGMLLVPTMAMGMQSMDNGEMEGVTGQAGVNIAVDDFKMYQNIDGLWYTDSDGIDGANTIADLGMDAASTGDAGASVGIKGLSVMVEVNAITAGNTATETSTYSDSDLEAENNDLASVGRDLQGDYENTGQMNFANNDDNTEFYSKPITIDVTQALPVLTAGAQNNGATVRGNPATVAGVRIALGTMEIVQSNMSLEVGVSDDTPLDGNSVEVTYNTLNSDLGTSYGTINIGKQTQAILDGNIEIAPH